MAPVDGQKNKLIYIPIIHNNYINIDKKHFVLAPP